ncbi:MAG TPA: methyltransferase domain-containing protein [Pyrinomonadaceae bacterium]|nr:methyltransferase domain-containing protein [Pyrinomonadaceae bacterium]
MIFKGVEICCPHCKGELREVKAEERTLECESCYRSFPVIFEIPDLRVFPDPYIDSEADRAKGLQVASRFEQSDFAALVDYYYSITSAVPVADAKRYTAGLLAGVARAEGSLISWEKSTTGNTRAASLLEIGCGTAPFMVAAASSFKRVVGVDIAFRWLVVAKRRLADAGLDLPLICACAEALPFPDEIFDRVVADSTLEHVTDQPLALHECHRVMAAPGYLFVSTPNRFSIGPDPQVGLWSGSLLPERWLAAYVRRQGGIPPKRHLLSARKLSAMIRQAGFAPPRVMLPDIGKKQRSNFGSGAQLLIDLYQTAKQMPLSRQALELVGPLLHAVAAKQDGVGLRA